MYADDPMTKAEVIAYLIAVAPAILPALALRPLTRRRWPEGTAGAGFFEKAAPAGMPDWIRTTPIPHEDGTVSYPLVEHAADLAWLGQVSALELHVPQWRMDRRPAGRLVLDLDPGPPAGLAEAAEVALVLRDVLLAMAMPSTPVTSGSKGIHLYALAPPLPDGATVSDLARQLGEHLERRTPSLVLTDMTRDRRPGRVLVDWSQNSPAKTTVCPYSLRGTRRPFVAAPRTWEEIESATLAQLTPADVLERLRSAPDPFASLAGA